MKAKPFRFAMVFVLSALVLPAQTRLDPEIQKIVGEVSKDRIAEVLRKLTSFETRGNFTDPNQQNRGIGAARQWIFDQFRSFSPRLEVSFDPFKVKKQGTRIYRDVDVVNVMAVLPGTTEPEKRIIVSGHYDSLNIIRRADAPRVLPDGSEPATDDVMDFEKSAEAPAPGASDDGSGTAVVMELARVMSQYKFNKTIVFVTFAGEEIGLVGSTLYADRAMQRKEQIEAVLNNDIVGNDVAGDGRAQSGLVRLFSEDPGDSGSRQLARYIRDSAQRYVPGFKVELVFRNDRFGRGGDHTPFNQDGFTAVRFTTAAENLGAQHSAEDLFDKTSPSFIAEVARVNAAAAANLAMAPSAPETMREITSGVNKGRKTPMLGRGKSRYDAQLRWSDPHPVANLAGYAVVMRPTTAPYWSSEIFAGKVSEYTLTGVSVDDVVLGVKAIDTEGHESLVSPYVVLPAFPHKTIELRD